MSYMHIQNLYRPEAQVILMFKECYAMEKIHGTSAHVSYVKGRTPAVTLFSGGTNPNTFAAIFNLPELEAKFVELGHDKVTVYGESYGGKEQGMSWLYGKQNRFIVFDVKIGNDEDEGSAFLSVPNADDVAQKLGLEFVHYVKVPATLENLDAQRDADSVQAVRNGVDLTQLPVGKLPMREGVVLRPVIEVRMNNGARICAKHKSDKFTGGGHERKNVPTVDDPEKLKLYADAQAAAEEFVTEGRLEHVLQKLPQDITIKDMPLVIKAMIEDVEREAKGEILENKETRKAISQKTVSLFKTKLQNAIPKE